MSFSSNTGNSNDLLLRTMMGRLYIVPSLETLLSQANDENKKHQHNLASFRKEESEVEEEIFNIIHSHKRNMLKPNSGESVTIRGHSICFTMTEENDPDRREWEWHGFINWHDSENRYSPEYTYGSHTEILVTEDLCDVIDENLKGIGLTVVGENNLMSDRILHRNNINASSSRN